MLSTNKTNYWELRNAFMDALTEADQRLLVALAVVFIPTLLILIIRIRSILSSRKKMEAPLPPGPRGVPLLGSLPFLDPELHSYFAELGRQYGPILKLQLGMKLAIVISSPATAREVLKDHDIIFANRDVPVAGLAATYGGQT
ncbi:unnamed protein product [Rhodiola kirilowii]